MATILILRGPGGGPMVIDELAARWSRAGHRVVSQRGTRAAPRADVVVLHVDTTRTPEDYRRLAERYPVVVNGRAVDVSKRRYCGLTLRAPEDGAGPVIVKTDANYGGHPDERYLRSRSRLGRLRRRLFGRPGGDWAGRTRLDPLAYPIFDRARDVPPGVWRNDALLVQRFVPERADGLFFVRYWVFFGEAGWARRFGSKQPIAKFHTRVTPEEPVTVPPALVGLRERLGLDYGRIDYAEPGGEPVVFDVNKTLSAGGNADEYAEELDRLAVGIDGFLARAGGRSGDE